MKLMVEECHERSNLGYEKMHYCLSMHQLIQDMGRYIVYEESPEEPGKRSRLWHHKDLFHVLIEKSGTSTIEGLILDIHMFTGDKFVSTRNSRVECLETNAFAKMSKLRLLQLNYVQFSGSFQEFPKALRWLRWHGFPLQSIPSDFPMENLIVLEMHHSSLKQVWKGTMIVDQLKVFDLSHSRGLKKTPDFSGVPDLEILILEGCQSLVEIHESIGKLEGLNLLNLKNCKDLRKLPKSMGMLKCLEILIISGCSSLKELPTEMRTMNSLKKLYASGIATKEEDNGFFACVWYSLIRPKSNKGVLSIPLPPSLVCLSLEGTNRTDDSFLVDFSNLFQLQYLNLNGTLICGLPECVKSLTSLQTICLNSCKRLESLMGVPNVESLEVVMCPFLKKVSFQQCPCPSLFFNCDKLVEIEGYFKLEPIEIIDIDMLRTWGFVNLESIINVKINYFNSRSGTSRKLPLQRLYESGVYSYFLPGSEISNGFSIKSSTGSPLSFVVPSFDNSRLRGLVVCSVYASPVENARYNLGLYTVIKNKTKHVIWHHYPMVVGVPRDKEDMICVSHWNCETLFGDGDLLEVSVHSDPFSGLRVKELAIRLCMKRSMKPQLQKCFFIKMSLPKRGTCWSVTLVNATSGHG